MVNMHLSDEQIQELALKSNSLPAHILAHAQSCEHCKLKIETYKAMFSVIEEQEAPAFNFDLAAAVVAQIETPSAKPSTKGLWWLFGITIAGILTAVAIYFGQYMTEVFEELKSLAIILFAISGLVVGIMLMIDQLKTYQRKMKMLDIP